MNADVLHSVSDVAIGLAGFGGIVAGLGYRAKGDWSVADRFRLYALIFLSLGVIFACYVPFVIDGLWPSSVWRISAGLFLSVPVVFVVGGAWSSRKLVPGQFSRTRLVIAWIASCCAIACLVAILLGDKSNRYFSLYLASVLAVLFAASMNFIGLILASFEKSE